MTDLNTGSLTKCTLCGKAIGKDGVVINGGLYHKICGKRFVATAEKDDESDMREVHLGA